MSAACPGLWNERGVTTSLNSSVYEQSSEPGPGHGGSCQIPPKDPVRSGPAGCPFTDAHLRLREVDRQQGRAQAQVGPAAPGFLMVKPDHPICSPESFSLSLTRVPAGWLAQAGLSQHGCGCAGFLPLQGNQFQKLMQLAQQLILTSSYAGFLFCQLGKMVTTPSQGIVVTLKRVKPCMVLQPCLAPVINLFLL